MVKTISQDTLEFIGKYGQTIVLNQILPHCDMDLTVELARGILLLDEAGWILSLSPAPRKRVRKEVIGDEKSVRPEHKSLLQKLWAFGRRRNKIPQHRGGHAGCGRSNI